MIDLLLLDILEEMVLEFNYLLLKKVLEIGKARIIKEGKKVALLNFGTRLRRM